jgi:hypothetical protein
VSLFVILLVVAGILVIVDLALGFRGEGVRRSWLLSIAVLLIIAALLVKGASLGG